MEFALVLILSVSSLIFSSFSIYLCYVPLSAIRGASGFGELFQKAFGYERAMPRGMNTVITEGAICYDIAVDNDRHLQLPNSVDARWSWYAEDHTRGAG